MHHTTSTRTGGSSSMTERNDVSAQLRDLERQGGGMARMAHVAAGLLLFAFSAGSLISISNAAFYRFLGEWIRGVFDVPDAISLVVNVLLVVCADIGLLYAASVLRTLVAAQAPLAEQRVHRWAMIGAAALESASYLYLVWMFDRPTTLFLWAIGITRALAAPLFAAYLSMARPLPVGPRDVAYQTALASGKGLVRDVTTLAGDPDASLERKVRIFTAASIMSPHDRARFDGIIEAVSERDPRAITQGTPVALPESHSARAYDGTQAADMSRQSDDTSSRSAAAQRDVQPRDDGNKPDPDGPDTPPTRPTMPDDDHDPDERDESAGTALYMPQLALLPRRGARAAGEMGRTPRELLRIQAFALLDADPHLSRNALRKALRCRQTTASTLYAEWQREQRRKRAVR